METHFAGGKGLLGHVPSYAVPTRLFREASSTAILLRLILLSSLPLAALEAGGTVAIDSTGFCTSCRGSYCTEKYDPGRKHRWIKAHLAIGPRTHAVLAVRVTDEHGGDCPQFSPLFHEVVESGFDPERVAANKAYLCRENLAGADALGIEPFIPFKVNSRGLARGSPMWNRKYHEFQLRRDEFDAAYHQRSNVESTFSAIKRKLGEPLLSKTTFARLNELLAKILAYNVGVISPAQLHGLEPSPTSFILRSPSLTQPAEAAS
jgi:transposase